MNRFFLIVLLVAGLACSADPGPVTGVSALTPMRSDPVWLTRTYAEDCSEGCWRIESVIFEDVGESGGNHHVYVHMRNQDGLWLAGYPFHVAYPDGDDRALTKAPPEVGDIAIWACFSPGEGEVGPYRVYAGDDPARSDVLWGVGLPECGHVNYHVVFREEEQVPVPPCGGLGCRELWLPVVLK